MFSWRTVLGFIGDIIGGITGSNKAAKAQQQAAKTQAGVAQQAIALQRETLLRNEQRQQPFVDAGSKAIAQQMGLIGLNGTAAQQDAINALLAGPEFTTSLEQGEEAILANAAATGGLRGGNTNNSLARFRADLLASTFANQFGRLRDLTSIGQSAAAGVGNQAAASTNAVSDLLQQQGAALAGGQIARGNSTLNGWNSGLKIASAIAAF
ncbi:hypothetical protein IC614_03075 [Allosphingosinicella flava]|uniref:DNA transfer protein n=1 Tax=Allosphingosinicella flava TaxID=2771430 RepID=A0A7T2LMH7_9SPHN|nr:hypothetical protein [Sphingosinicella flava]QPQ55599.1 hypothetical protein IC614_03075 [Sphingosinicella flava]